MNDSQLAEISELAARYFCGWKPKPVGERRFPAFAKDCYKRARALEEQAVAATPTVS